VSPWFETYLLLPSPEVAGELVGCRVESADGIWIAKDATGFPQLLIQPASDTPNLPRFMLRHLEIDPACRCTVRLPSSPPEQFTATRIRCLATEPELTDFFFRTTATIIDSMPKPYTSEAICAGLDRVAELFRQLSGKPTRTLQGLWAELFLLSRATDMPKAASAWQTSPHALTDFSDRDESVEVKSTTGDSRRHHFKLAQLVPPAGHRWVVASLLLHEDPQGTSLQSLWERIEDGLAATPHLRIHVASRIATALGESWRFSESYRVNEALAAADLRVFNVAEIPRLDSQPFPAISNVEFVVDLSGVNAAHADGRLIANLLASFA